MDSASVRAAAVCAALLAVAGPTYGAEPWDLSNSTPVRGENLLLNGDFEQGERTPVGWQTVDGLTSFWVRDKDPERSKVIRFDTDVLQSQAYQWWAKIVEGAGPDDAPVKVPSTDPNKYDTVAAFDGVWFFSDFVPIEPGKEYWLTVDAKGGEMMCWLLGYKEKYEPSFGDDEPAFLGYLRKRTGYDSKQRDFEKIPFKRSWKGQLKIGGADRWLTYSRREKPFNPTKNTPSVRYVRVLVLPFWPPGEYYIDNVCLFEYAPDGKGRAPDEPSRAAGQPGADGSGSALE